MGQLASPGELAEQNTMGKIIDALKVARGDVPELVLRSLEEPAGHAARPANGKPRVQTLPVRVDGEPEPEPAPVPAAAAAPAPVPVPVPAEAPVSEPGGVELPVRRLSFTVAETVPLLSAPDERPYAAEQYRILRTRIIQHPAKPAVVVVSSPGIGDGKTVTATNLAAAFAMNSEEEILLIDADLRCSAVHRYLRAPKTPGLAEVLAGTARFEEAAFRVGQIPSLCVLPAGDAGTSATELLGSSRWPALIQSVRKHFRHVIVDCPPVEAVADYDLIAAVCDAVLLVVRPDYTNRLLFLRAVAKTKPKSLGVVINGAADRALPKQYLSRYYTLAQKEEKEKTGQ
jgi:protein-tyrosine kinase